MQSETRSDDNEASAIPRVLKAPKRVHSSIKRLKPSSPYLRHIDSGGFIKSRLTLETGDTFLNEVLQPLTENERRLFPHPAFKINIHETSIGKRRRTLYDIGNDADAPMALFQSGGFETKVKSSGLSAKEATSPIPDVPAPPNCAFKSPTNR
ncbi:hypothetical protein SAMN05216593_101615 [Pseudomonas asturiensis]|uniref:Uncharacterized protein n=1 Tax=Pseudomonas asturiensis TaxID=1190415 RepID=A0A1M7JXZ1_9PSED|nr:hypothetical protein [Pseudomonas asturiensis]SHM57858.1 hypothetical protein SAMN05216593_101615 [Pseudomonas asturiensis]